MSEAADVCEITAFEGCVTEETITLTKYDKNPASVETSVGVFESESCDRQCGFLWEQK